MKVEFAKKTSQYWVALPGIALTLFIILSLYIYYTERENSDIPNHSNYSEINTPSVVEEFIFIDDKESQVYTVKQDYGPVQIKRKSDIWVWIKREDSGWSTQKEWKTNGDFPFYGEKGIALAFQAKRGQSEKITITQKK